jgi:D-alanyl-D-alanine carboxypeptidase
MLTGRKRANRIRLPLCLFFALPLITLSCIRQSPGDAPQNPPSSTPVSTPAGGEDLPDLAEALAVLARGQGEGSPGTAAITSVMSKALNRAELPPELALKLEAAAAESPAFILDLLSCLEADPFLRRLVDKRHALPQGYEPEDLVELDAGSFEVGRRGLMLRSAAAQSLEAMAAAARADGVVLVVSSTYRSYNYQVGVYNRVVREIGQAAADRESAPPGHSQHQTGLVVDFGSIDDSFAQTPAGRWIAQHASRFGWSISFPDGYEAITGYRWESWHYRYVGEDLATFIDTWFDGVQQYALQFIKAWEEQRAE